MSDEQKREGTITDNRSDEFDEVNQDETNEGFLTPKRVKEDQRDDEDERLG